MPLRSSRSQNVLHRRFGKSGAGAGLVPGFHIFLIWVNLASMLADDGTSVSNVTGTMIDTDDDTLMPCGANASAIFGMAAACGAVALWPGDLCSEVCRGS